MQLPLWAACLRGAASTRWRLPLIINDPLADNTNLYVFRSPDAATNDANTTVTIIASYISFELPQVGPNFGSFGKNGRPPAYDWQALINNFLPTFGDMLRINLAVPHFPHRPQF